MSYSKEYIAKLAAKWEQRTITTEEELVLNEWYRQHQDEQVNIPTDFVLSEAKHEHRIWNAIQKQIGLEKKVVPLFGKTWVRTVTAAAAIIIVVAIGLMLYTNNSKNIELAIKNNDVAPGKVGATLTLSNGKKIRLTDATDGELAKEAGVVITKAQNGELIYEIKGYTDAPNKINTLATANAETYKLRLPDGSFVWLNAASSISYSAQLIENGKRNIKLKGEAYFEVAKDKDHPFVVQTDKQEIEVLGTHFNVNAYKDEPVVTTTLLEGSVKVSGTTSQTVRVLKPGDQSANTGLVITVNKVDTEAVTDWKNGEFIFKGEDFKTAMRRIARWYDVEIVYDPGVQTNIEPGGWISRKSNLSAVLQLIENAGNVHFKIEGRRILVTR